MKLDNRKLAEVWRAEYEATRNVETAVGAVAMAILARLEYEDAEEGRRTYRPDELAEAVRQAVARHYRIDLAHLGEPWARRSQLHVDARWTIAIVLRRLGQSLPASARAAGLRHHQPLLHAIRALPGRPDIQAAVDEIEARFARKPALAASPPSATTASEVAA